MTALQHAGDGGVLLFGGHYNEPVTVTGLSGDEGKPIVVQPLRGQQVTIDCLEEKFLVHTPAAHWRGERTRPSRKTSGPSPSRPARARRSHVGRSSTRRTTPA